MPLEDDDSPDPLAVSLRRENDSAGALRLPGALARYAREMSPAAIEATAHEVLKSKSRDVRVAVQIAQLLDYLTVIKGPTPGIVLLALGGVLEVTPFARRWLVHHRGREQAAALGLNDRTVRRILSEPMPLAAGQREHAFAMIADGLDEASLWAALAALGLIVAPELRKRNGPVLTQGAIEALTGLRQPDAFIKVSRADSRPLDHFDGLKLPEGPGHSITSKEAAEVASVHPTSAERWRDDPKRAAAYRLNQMHDAAWSHYNGKAGAIQNVVPSEHDPLSKSSPRKRTK